MLPLGARGAGSEVGAGKVGGSLEEETPVSWAAFWTEFSRGLAGSKLLTINMALSERERILSLLCCWGGGGEGRPSLPPSLPFEKSGPLMNAACWTACKTRSRFSEAPKDKGELSRNSFFP